MAHTYALARHYSLRAGPTKGPADARESDNVVHRTSEFAHVKRLSNDGSRLRKTTQLFVNTRAHRAMIEAELYGNRYMHTSKNDDDLPVIRKGDMA
jgi:hypothetical protein